MIDNPENSTVRCPKCGYLARAGAAACPGCYSQLPTATPDIATPQARPPKPAGKFGLKFGRKQEAPPPPVAPVEPPAAPRVFTAPVETESAEFAEPPAPAELVGFDIAPPLETPETVQDEMVAPPVFDLPSAVVEEPPLDAQSAAPAVPDLGDIVADYAAPEAPAATPPLQPFDVSTLGPQFAEPAEVAEQESPEEADFSTPVGYDLSEMTIGEPEPPIASDVDVIPDYTATAETFTPAETQEAEIAEPQSFEPAPPVEPEVELGPVWTEDESAAPVGYDLSDFSLPAAPTEEGLDAEDGQGERFEIGGFEPLVEEPVKSEVVETTEPEIFEPVQEFGQEPVDFTGFDIDARVIGEPEAIEAIEPEILESVQEFAQEPVDFSGFDIGAAAVVAEEPENVEPVQEFTPEPIDFSGLEIGEPAVVVEEPEVVESVQEFAQEPVDFSGFTIGEAESVAEEPKAVEEAGPEIIEPVDFTGFDIGEPAAPEAVAEPAIPPTVESAFVDYAAPTEPVDFHDVQAPVEPAERAEPEVIVVPTPAAQRPIPGLEIFDLSDIPGFETPAVEAAATVESDYAEPNVADYAEPNVFELIERPTEPETSEVVSPAEPVVYGPSDSPVYAPPAEEAVIADYSAPELAAPFESFEIGGFPEPAAEATVAEPEVEEPVASAAYDLSGLADLPPAEFDLPAAATTEQVVEEQTAPWESTPAEMAEHETPPVLESEVIAAEVEEAEEPVAYDLSGVGAVEPVDLSWPEMPAAPVVNAELEAPEEAALVDFAEAPPVGEPEIVVPVATESLSAETVEEIPEMAAFDEAVTDAAPVPAVLPEPAARRRKERVPKPPRLPKPPKPIGPSLSSRIRPQAQKVSAAVVRAAVVVAVALKTAALSSKVFVATTAARAAVAVSAVASKAFSRVRRSSEAEVSAPAETPVTIDHSGQSRTAAMLASVRKLPKRVLTRGPRDTAKVELPVGEIAADSVDPTSCDITATPVASELIETLHAAWVRTEPGTEPAQQETAGEAAVRDESEAELAGQAFEAAAPWESLDTAVVEEPVVAGETVASEVWQPISVSEESAEEISAPSTSEVLMEMAEELALAETAVPGAIAAAKPAGLAAAGAAIAGIFIVPARAMGGIVKMVGSKLKRSSGLISRYREARKAGAVRPGPASPRMSEFESGMLGRLASVIQVAAWADELASLNAETERILIQLSEPNEAHHPDLENLVETVRSAIQDDARRIQDVKDNPYSLYWNLWLKDEREIMSTDVGSLAQRIEAMDGMESVCSRLVSLKDRYQSSDPKFYAHFGSIVLLYDTYPPDSVKKLAKQAGLTQCGRALAPK